MHGHHVYNFTLDNFINNVCSYICVIARFSWTEEILIATTLTIHKYKVYLTRLHLLYTYIHTIITKHPIKTVSHVYMMMNTNTLWQVLDRQHKLSYSTLKAPWSHTYVAVLDRVVTRLGDTLMSRR